MTRLSAEDIAPIADTLSGYDDDLRAKTGRSLVGLACHAAGAQERSIAAKAGRCRAQIVPVTWGQGAIKGFDRAVAAILNHIGLAAGTGRQSNVGGLGEAFERGCDLIFIADDDDFVVLNSGRKKSVHNADATGRGFAAGLDCMAGGIYGRTTLVLGCGPVGAGAAAELLRRGALVTVYDVDLNRGRRLAGALSASGPEDVRAADDLEESVRRHKYILDATPAAGIIDDAMIAEDTFVAAPGMPLGLTAAAARKAGRRLLHDPLPIGVATMAVLALADRPGLEGSNRRNRAR